VDLGRNVAVDESSIACRSKFGRHLILYNATKPTGKYHFKIYACCCSTTWLAYNLRLHCASGIGDRLGGNYTEGEIRDHEAATIASKDVRKHVLEVTMPIFGSKRIVNTDNYYTSCQLLEALRVKGLYGRGTIRENSKFGPKCFMLSKTDKAERGAFRQGVELKHRIVGASWADGSVVDIVSNADASTVSTLTRLVGQVKTEFRAPTAIKNYNQAMQSVDRLDQLRARFSLADGHTFTKWHKKLTMVFIDIARCNAFIYALKWQVSQQTSEILIVTSVFDSALNCSTVNGRMPSARKVYCIATHTLKRLQTQLLQLRRVWFHPPLQHHFRVLNAT